MRLAELSERSGVSTATIKYYLREGLLPPGRRVTATQAEYDEEHLRRLRLVRALIQVGRVPIATAREVLTALEDDSLDHNTRLGTAVWALPHGPGARRDRRDRREAARRTRRRAAGPARLAARAGVGARIPGVPACWWPRSPRCAGSDTPATVDGLGAVRAAGAPTRPSPTWTWSSGTTSPDEQVEAAVALTVLYEPVLLSLRRLAQAEESNRRYGAAGAAEERRKGPP